MKKRQQRPLLFLLAAVNFTHITDLVIVMPLGDKLMDLWSINPKQFGIVMSAYTLAAACSSLGAAFFIDKLDRRHALLFTYIGFALGTLGCALAPSYLGLVVARAITGFFGGLIGALVLSIISDLYPLERRGMAMGVITGALAIAIILGLPLGLILTDAWDWHAPFYCLAGLSFIIVIGLYFIMPPMTGHRSGQLMALSPFTLFRQAINHPNQIKGLVLAGLLILAALMVIAFIPAYLTRNVGLSGKELRYVLLIGGAVTIVATPILGKVTDRFGPKPVFYVLILLAIAPILIVTHLSVTPLWMVLLVTAFFFILVLGQLIPAQTIITAAVGPSARGSYMSIKSAVQQFAASLATFLGGAIMTTRETKRHFQSEMAQPPLEHFDRVGWIAAAICVVAFLISIGLKVAAGNREGEYRS